METISGTTASVVRGWSWGPDATPIAVEPGGDLAVVITTAPGGSVEWRDLDSAGQPTGGWTAMAPGASIARGKGQRVQLRPFAGTAAVTFAWSGAGLEALAQYRGSRGSKVSWG